MKATSCYVKEDYFIVSSCTNDKNFILPSVLLVHLCLTCLSLNGKKEARFVSIHWLLAKSSILFICLYPSWNLDSHALNKGAIFSIPPNLCVMPGFYLPEKLTVTTKTKPPSPITLRRHHLRVVSMLEYYYHPKAKVVHNFIHKFIWIFNKIHQFTLSLQLRFV